MGAEGGLPMRTNLRQRGVSLVEALVALVVMSVGMLGIASLYVTSLQSNRTALMRTQAVTVVNDMADRIRANSRGRANYKTADYVPGTPGTTNDCKDTCSPSELAKSDLAAWIASYQPLFPQGTVGMVDYTEGDSKPDVYHIALSWPEAGQGDNKYQVTLQLIPVRP
jgi:type IV pilus assembly protein PilV